MLFTPRRVEEFGLLLAAVGALMIAVGAISFLQHPSDPGRRRERAWLIAGAGVMAIGFLVQFAALLAR